MVLLGLEIPLWLLLTLGICLLFYWYGTLTFDTFKKLGIPYRTPLIPCIGNLHQQLSKSMAEYDMEQKTKFPGKICGAFQGRVPILEIGDPEFYYQISTKEFTKFRNRTNVLPAERFSKSLLFIVDDHWKHVRGMLTSTFTSGKLKQMYEVINGCADELVDHMRKSGDTPIVIKEYASGYTADVIASIAFGMDIDIQSTTNHEFVVNAGTFLGMPKDQSLKSMVKHVWNIFAIVACPTVLRKFIGYLFKLSFLDEESCDYVEAIIDGVLADLNHTHSKGRAEKNFITMVADKMVDLKNIDKSKIHISADNSRWTTEGLTKEEVYSNAVVFIAAGYETTATALQFLLYLMAVNPDIQEKLYNEIAELPSDCECTYEELQQLQYLDQCLNESLRILPPVVRTDRICNEACTIGGVHIPKGLTINGLVFAMHRDADYWPDPETYDPERFSPENRSDSHKYAFLPFGAGNRMCIAYRLAMLEVKVAAVKVLSRFKMEKTDATPEVTELVFKIGGAFLQTAAPLRITAVARS